MRDPEGFEWLPLPDVFERLPHVPAGTVRSWISRGQVASEVVDGRRWVRWVDVATMAATSCRRRRAGAA